MTAKTGQTTSPTSSAPGAFRSMPVTTASVTKVKPARPQRPALSQAIIAQKAYDIWLSQGQKPGCEKKHWYEAELQLQRA